MSKYILINCILFALVFQAYCARHRPIVENKIANILLRSSSLIENSPQRSLECFSIYIPKLNELTTNYETEYGTCLERSTEDRGIVDLEVQRDRSDLEESVVDVCDKFKGCSSKNESAFDFFECFNDVAGGSTKAVYNIQNISKDKMEYIKMKYETIEYDLNRCTDKCSRVYLEESAKIYDDLDKCLAGVVIEPPSQIPNVKV